MALRILRAIRRSVALQLKEAFEQYTVDCEIIEALEQSGFDPIYEEKEGNYPHPCLGHWSSIGGGVFLLISPRTEAEAEYYVYHLQEVFRVCPQLHTIDDWRVELVSVVYLAGHKVDVRIELPSHGMTCTLRYEQVVVPEHAKRVMVGVDCGDSDQPEGVI